MSNLAFNVVDPANYSLADLYYDATLIRVPYRKGVVWKWYTYWDTLVLEGSNWMRPVFALPRKVATGLISRPYRDQITQRGMVLAHLGFWSLWASAEGLEVMTVTVTCGKTKSCRVDTTRETEIYMVGHSLGGAVSWFASLNIVAELQDKFPNVKVFHATFGAPPVGTKRFSEHFRRSMAGHQSWAVFHKRDQVANCFAWLGSIRGVKLLPWWSNGSRAGAECVIQKLGTPTPSTVQINDGRVAKFFRFVRTCLPPDTLKMGGILARTLIFLGVSSLTTPLSITATPVCWLMDWKQYKKQENPPANWKDASNEDNIGVQGLNEDLDLHNLDLNYHGPEKYV